MADRALHKTGKDTSGEITFVCGGSAAVALSPRSKASAITNIETGLHTYYVPWTSGRTEIRTVNGRTGKYPRTDRDSTVLNSLLDLPDC